MLRCGMGLRDPPAHHRRCLDTPMITILCLNGRAFKTVEYGFSLQEAVDNMNDDLSLMRHYQVQHGKNTARDMYACGLLPPHYPMPALAIGASIQPHIVDIITHTQPRLPADTDWVSADCKGYVWSLAHWWNDEH